MTTGLWLIVVIIVVAAFLIYATRKRWISWKGGSGISYLTAFHDFQTKDKQEAIEYVMEEKAGKKMEEQESDEEK
jgi:hypothetical protein